MATRRNLSAAQHAAYLCLLAASMWYSARPGEQACATYESTVRNVSRSVLRAQLATEWDVCARDCAGAHGDSYCVAKARELSKDMIARRQLHPHDAERRRAIWAAECAAANKQYREQCVVACTNETRRAVRSRALPRV